MQLYTVSSIFSGTSDGLHEVHVRAQWTRRSWTGTRQMSLGVDWDNGDDVEDDDNDSNSPLLQLARSSIMFLTTPVPTTLAMNQQLRNTSRELASIVLSHGLCHYLTYLTGDTCLRSLLASTTPAI